MSSQLQQEKKNDESFSIGTYNVWFGSDGRGQPCPEARMKAVVQALLEEHHQHAPIITIGFQEVIPPTATMLQSELKKHGYQLMKQPTNSYGCALAVLVDGRTLVDSGWQNYSNTAMNRGFLWARLKLSDTAQEILVTTTHLESPVDAAGITNRSERVAQLRFLESFCNRQLQNHHNLAAAIITGDCNWDEKVPGTSDMMSSLDEKNAWTDAWLATNDDPGYTYDCICNSLLTGDRQGRLDRILIRSHSGVVPVESCLVGQDAIPGVTISRDDAWTETSADGYSTPTRTTRTCPVLPSDHFGVVVRLQKQK